MAIYPWIVPHTMQGQNLSDFPNLNRWFQTIGKRPAVVKAYEIAKAFSSDVPMTEEAKRILFGLKK